MPAAISVFMKNVEVFMRNTVVEIDDVAGVNGFAEEARFKVKMRACRAACISAESNGLPRFGASQTISTMTILLHSISVPKTLRRC